MFDSFSYGNDSLYSNGKQDGEFEEKKLTSLQKIMICKIMFQFSWIFLVCKGLIFTQKIWALTPHITLTRKALKFTNHHQTVHYTENDTAKPHFTDTS